MFNPLLSDITKLKNEDLENKITELMQKHFIAAKFGQGHVCQQIGIILEAYREEQKRRYNESNKRVLQQNKNLDDFINVDS